MSVVNKICVCLCCSECACWMSSCYDEWAASEACGLACLNCAGCGWTLFAPIPHSLKFGECGKAMEQFKKGGLFCVYSLILNFVAPIDGCINCVLYLKKNFQSGVSGSGDMLENCMFIGKKAGDALGLKGSNEPESTFKSYSP